MRSRTRRRRPAVRRRRELQPEHRSQLRRRVRPVLGLLPELASREGHRRRLHRGPLSLHGEDLHGGHAAALPRPAARPRGHDPAHLLLAAPPAPGHVRRASSGPPWTSRRPSSTCSDLPRAPNPFLGRSIFSPRARRVDEPGIALIGPELFLVGRDGIARRGRLGAHAREFWRVQRVLRYLAGLEESDRIWPRGDARAATPATRGPPGGPLIAAGQGAGLPDCQTPRAAGGSASMCLAKSVICHISLPETRPAEGRHSGEADPVGDLPVRSPRPDRPRPRASRAAAPGAQAFRDRRGLAVGTAVARLAMGT